MLNNQNHYQVLQHAKLDWDENALPLSSEFDDVYFSKASGLDETRYVFLQHNQLPERWQNFDYSAGQSFVIAETGFGTGLNFLCAWQAFQQTAPETASLHFISVEKFPLRLDDLKKSLSLWPELQVFAEQLIEAYPLPIGGVHRRHFAEGRVQLTLLQGDASTLFSSLEAKVDAWFLDGFAPAKNPEMWTDELFQAIRRLSDHGTTVATFTAAGIVRNGLKAAGFDVKKVKGFGRKRHMVCGELIIKNGQPVQTINPAPDVIPIEPLPLAQPWRTTPWFQPPSKSQITKTLHCAVIGAGIAGTTSAQALARQGYKVSLIDQATSAGSAGSGNRQGVLYIKLGTEPSPHSQFYLSGFEFSRHYFQRYAQPENWQATGVLQLATDDKEQQRQRNFLQRNTLPEQLLYAVDTAQASNLAGTALGTGGLFYPNAGWAKPARLCEQFSLHQNIEFLTNCTVDQLQPCEQGWQLLNAAGEVIVEAQQVVIACAASAKKFSQCAWLPIKSIRGQTTYIQTQSNSPILKTVVCHEGYIAPAIDDKLCMGASFNLRDETTELRMSDQVDNLAMIKDAMPAFYQALEDSQTDITSLNGKVGFRCASPDYLPLVGPLPIYDQFIESYGALRQDAKAMPDTAPSYHQGLYLNIGHGSRGLASAPLAAEMICSYITGQPQPLERELLNALQPSRFIIKSLIRKKV
ncbi:tRNA 5-methylaminomethyl-2-thiouridine biosynthesis bifunctional protein [Oceanospirillum multiglobuliferum]|uniref:bifunctional tRNA (5-methylaminomethyl-2-thiouridine)(34)-methyltransferase MnmD/FAD-dependent 5-carboxymethylaminomethyl-2-thiouridine(34) oxidoreductase MnmC n=1 Tax=Oceanospirillum multiglobuliferum TaxID=64969 RepID=UPI0009CFCD20|nr:bifunctional tRNA (5-methylaminomethyl-2-thiouridine)(34)-methyltransferase MnmD/FAD-dependent 5-carboxymethylaminomethyl-2-thiouridine(34) oxidoreductase MnmC [Oceanospirillum multiglobuliferum]SJZ50624.1 tRNA 5-methylaminomethyl-2-thiouridine biosynthesis bifunctional protein [Oceanospirillum multiglobuliferum]